jgi:hypothetical protein
MQRPPQLAASFNIERRADFVLDQQLLFSLPSGLLSPLRYKAKHVTRRRR